LNVEQEYQLRLSRAYRELEETELSTQQFQLRLRLVSEGVATDAIENRVADCFESRWERLNNLYSTNPNAKVDTTSPDPINNSRQEQLQQDVEDAAARISGQDQNGEVEVESEPEGEE